MKIMKILLSIFLLLGIYQINSSFAHDTDLYMASGQGVAPNILIIFDNSGSMNDDVQTGFYDPNVTYPGSSVPTQVYYKSGSNWLFFANSISDVACASARTALTTQGNYIGNTNASCKGTSRTLRTGNYRNYIASGGDQYDTKLHIAKTVITGFLNSINGVRLGIMEFNTTSPYDKGGHLQSPITDLSDAGKIQLTTDINNIVATTWTPLAKTLYEAGLYFKGGPGYFDPGVTYISPVQYPCQRNYVVIITDGQSTHDQASILNTAIGDRDGDKREPPGAVHDPHYADSGTDYLDDVANYLYNTDLRSDLTGQQNIITYTIGFTENNDLLERTATQGHGKYFYTNNAQELSDAFQNIVDEILSVTSSFVAPVVPVSKMERTTEGDKIYLALFKPIQNQMWSGNIKKYGIAQQASGTIQLGDIIDVNGKAALDSTGQFYDTAQSYWTSAGLLDGGDAEKGGVGEVLMNRDFCSTANTNPRKIYTYNTTIKDSNLTYSSNAFNTTNITPSMLGLGADSDPVAQGSRNNLVNFVYGCDAYDDNGNGITNEKRDWVLGPFLHSRPLVIHYGPSPTSQTVIFGGSNDGMLHVFDDDTGVELWGFIPPNVLTSLQALHTDLLVSFVDGSPKAYISRNMDGSISQAILIVGERRGGNRYYALDVTNPSAPKYLWEINPDAAGSPYVEMGQTWSAPTIRKIACQGAGTCIGGGKWVAFVGGGYDDKEDNDVPPADTKGRAIYVIDVLDGSLIKRLSNAEIPAMTYSIPSDITKVDTNGDGKIDRLYVGDMGGRMWRFDIGDPNPTSWTGRIIFAGYPGTKIFYPPDVTLEVGDYEMLFFGTGDREHPKETAVINRLYAIKDKNLPETLTESSLVDVTSDELQATGTTEARKTEILTDLGNKSGWFIQLSQYSGEKCLSPSSVLNKVSYYATFAPGAGGESDPCYVGEGAARVYALQYQTGNAVFNFDLTNDTGGSVVINKTDQSKSIGHGIPSGVVITFVQGKAVGYIGVGGGISKVDPHAKLREPKYWKIVF
jgi:type IV pilus assembly protein PilY1